MSSSSLTSVMPAVMLTLVVIYLLGVTGAALFKSSSSSQVTPLIIPWQLPGVVSLFFLAWSIYTIVQEGSFAVWSEHTRSLWGNQIWFDLIFGVAITWTLVLPRALAVQMRIVPWLVLVLATANIGLLAMLSRLLYLEQRQGQEYTAILGAN